MISKSNPTSNMSKKWPVGNCEPSSVPEESPNRCDINIITKDNQIRNIFNQLPRSYILQEHFNVCKEPVLIQPKLQTPPICSAPKNSSKRPHLCHPHEWANISPNHMGGSVRFVKKENETIFPIVGKIDIPNYFQPPYTTNGSK